MTQEQLIALGWQIAGWLLPFILPPLAVYAIRYARAQAHYWENEDKSGLLMLLDQFSETAVMAAEQALVANADKKTAALDFVNESLKAHNINLPVFQIEAAIESAVLTETKHGGNPPAPQA